MYLLPYFSNLRWGNTGCALGRFSISTSTARAILSFEFIGESSHFGHQIFLEIDCVIAGEVIGMEVAEVILVLIEPYFSFVVFPGEHFAHIKGFSFASK
jgi:hypothetical protein